jgi:hypothetical protein
MSTLHLGSEGYATDGTNGRVGVGTSTPGCVLDVNVPNSGTPTMIALSNSGGGYADVAEFDYDATNSPNPLTLSLKHSRPFVVSGGNVGIGTRSPQGTLDVSGTIGGLVVPRLTSVQESALIGLVDGTIIYNTTLGKFRGRENGAWMSF